MLPVWPARWFFPFVMGVALSPSTRRRSFNKEG